MLKIQIKFIILLVFITTANSLTAQTFKSFSEDPEKYYDELYDYMNQANADLAENLMEELLACWPMDDLDEKKEEKIYKKANKQLSNRYKKIKVETDFEYNFETKKFNKEQIKLMIKTSNKMLDNRLKPIPHFESYILSLLSFINTNQSNESFEAWNIAIDKLLNENRRYFVQFMDNCNKVFLYNAVYVNPNLSWLRTTDKFSFDYDSLPKIVFEEMNLICVARNDSSIIYNTKGTYYPTQEIWHGIGGEVLWTRANKDASITKAKLKNYSIDLRTPYFKADSVWYKNTKYLQNPIYGRLEERVLANQTPEKATFPKFYSYSKRVKIEELVDSVDYEGGFAINGGKFIGKGTEDKNASITFKKNNKPFLVANATSFTIDDELIATQGAMVKMYLDTDSIYHPYVRLKFLNEKRELTLYKEDKGIGAAPYTNSYHRMDMDIEWIKWEIDKPYIEMGTIIGSSNHELTMESSNYYSPERFNRLQGLGDVHPLYRIKEFIEEENSGYRKFNDRDFAIKWGMDINQVKLHLIGLTKKGFLQYDVKEGKVIAQNKLFDYVLAKSDKGDYDNIAIVSNTEGGANAKMNLVNYDISFVGVRGVAISNKRKTGFIPKKGEFKLHRNRNMTFSGVLRSGNYEFHGSNFDFDYDKYSVKLNEVDSARFMAANPKLQRGEEIGYSMVQSVIEDIRGELNIDYPTNKSGIRKDSFPDYPKFNCTQNAYVRYDRRNKQGNVYDGEDVYFRLDPFEVDSLDAFTNEGIAFSGMFNSGGIFPDFEEDLILMPDHSLGFIKKTPPEGMPMYDNKAVFKNDIKLSNEGVMGDGDFEYITSLTQSKAFIFYPDSMKAMALNFEVEPQIAEVEYTDVKAEKVKVHFNPIDNFLSVKDQETPLNMYEGGTKLSGELIYQHSGMTGNGVADFDNAELTSNIFEFNNRKFNADTSDFKLKVEDVEGSIAFSTNNVSALIDFDARTGDFVSNGGGSFVDFPANQYFCYMDEFKWFMDDFELEISASDDVATSGDETANSDLDLSGSEFISTHPDQDSLKFISPSANYDLKKYIIKAHDVKYINVADARIYPSDGEVRVEKKAKMLPLEGAKILANTTTQYHTINNAKVYIKARRDYTAEGDYQYVDASGEEQKVNFDNIRVDNVYQTIASGEIKEDQNFMLSPYFAYKGKTSIEANKLGMLFKGGTKLQHNCELSKSWIPFEAEIDPENVLIPIDSSIKSMDSDAKLATGIALKMDSTHVYGGFLSPKKFHSDQLIVTADGFLKYDESTGAYQISNKEKLNEITFPGNYIAMNSETCEITSEGEVKMHDDLGQVKLSSFGKSVHNPNNDSTAFNLLMSMDFFIDKNMWKHMSDNIVDNEALEPAGSNENYERAIMNKVGKELGDKLISELNLFGQFKKVPDEMIHNLLFSQVNMTWNTEKKSFISNGPLGLGLMEKDQVNRFVEGYIQIERSKKKEELNIYIDTDQAWYFFSYSNGIMKCLSSSDEFNQIISELEDKKREQKGEKSEGDYIYMLATQLSIKKFLNNMEN